MYFLQILLILRNDKINSDILLYNSYIIAANL